MADEHCKDRRIDMTITDRGLKTAEGPDAERLFRVRNHNFWEQKAAEFAESTLGAGYAEGFLDIIDVEQEWTVLDMASGGGTIAIPLAGKVKSVTAVDSSETVLQILERRCREKNITNITRIRGRWEDDWDALGIGTHDVAIASRSLLAFDPLAGIGKLNRTAKRRVYISMSVGDGPFDRRVFEATGRKLDTGPSYTYIYYNVLYQHLGLLANIAFVREEYDNGWGSREEALDAQRWMFHDLTEEEEEKLRFHLGTTLIDVDGKWRLPYERHCTWAVLWWEKK